jgi:hypothetical protein
MDPLQAIAAHQVSPIRKSKSEEIEAFYDAHAFAGVHNARRALIHLIQLLRGAPSRLGRKAPTAPKFVSIAGRA